MRCNKKRGACGVVVNALLLAGANAAGGVWRMNELNGLFIRRVINGNRRTKKWGV